MTQINLIPWREQKRTQEKKSVITMLLAGILGSLFVVFLMTCYASKLLHNQMIRNQLLKQKITHIDDQLK